MITPLKMATMARGSKRRDVVIPDIFYVHSKKQKPEHNVSGFRYKIHTYSGSTQPVFSAFSPSMMMAWDAMNRSLEYFPVLW